jgi:hypothetical protein
MGVARYQRGVLTALQVIGAITVTAYVIRVVVVLRETGKTRKALEQIGDVWHGSTSG